jgi:hypothetical protein
MKDVSSDNLVQFIPVDAYYKIPIKQITHGIKYWGKKDPLSTQKSCVPEIV